jgi:ribosomal-protein-alanine N-acetyltransferase
MGFRAMVKNNSLPPPSRKRTKGLLRLGFKLDGELVIEGERFIRYRLFKDNNRKTHQVA